MSYETWGEVSKYKSFWRFSSLVFNISFVLSQFLYKVQKVSLEGFLSFSINEKIAYVGQLCLNPLKTISHWISLSYFSIPSTFQNKCAISWLGSFSVLSCFSDATKLALWGDRQTLLILFLAKKTFTRCEEWLSQVLLNTKTLNSISGNWVTFWESVYSCMHIKVHSWCWVTLVYG